MDFNFLTPELFNGVIVISLIVGVILAGFRFYRDMTRPLPRSQSSHHNDATKPNLPK